MIRLAMTVIPMTDENLRRACQVGVEELAVRSPDHYGTDLPTLCGRAESAGLKVGVVEGFMPLEPITFGGDGRDEAIETIAALIRQMGEYDVPIMCYNFMAGSDWSRTSVTESDRGGALVSAFEPSQLPVEEINTATIVGQDQLWENLQYFLDRIIPVAEKAGVTLAMHPDDPPLPEVQGQARIMIDPDSFDRLLSMSDSPSNGICFCQGVFSTMGVDIPTTIRRFAERIRFVHFRDVRHTETGFVETFHDNGPTDMVAAMQTYHDIGFDGPMRPDHAPQLAGEQDGEPGYTMLGRLYAIGYMRGLMQAVGAA